MRPHLPLRKALADKLLLRDVLARSLFAKYQADFETLRGQGFTDSDIWDIGAVAAFFGLSNRMANLADMKPNAEFYTMGRG